MTARTAPARGTADEVDLWSQPVTPPPAKAAPGREQLTRVLTMVATELARKAGPAGITVCDIRIYSEQRGVLTGAEAGRSLSWLNQIPKKAGLVATGQVRASTRPRAHGNFQRVWVLAVYAPSAVR